MAVGRIHEREFVLNQESNIVLAAVQGHVCTITINRPEARNALHDGVITGIGQALAQAAADPQVRAVVLTGAGNKAFCAGADLKPGSGIFDFDYSQPTTAYANLLRQVMAYTLPLVARVNGACMAGGMGLLTMCDLAVAADHCRFGLPEVKIGLFPLQVAAVMQNMVQRRKFAELCITGEPITAHEALEMGLVNYVVKAEDLDTKMAWLLARIVDKSPTAIRRGKYALRAIEDMTFAQSIAHMETEIATLRLTADAQEGLTAFVEKRAPSWTGR